MLPFFAAFVMWTFRFYKRNSNAQFSDINFIMAGSTFVAMLIYMIGAMLFPGVGSVMPAGAAIAWIDLAVVIYTYRRWPIKGDLPKKAF